MASQRRGWPKGRFHFGTGEVWPKGRSGCKRGFVCCSRLPPTQNVGFSLCRCGPTGGRGQVFAEAICPTCRATSRSFAVIARRRSALIKRCGRCREESFRRQARFLTPGAAKTGLAASCRTGRAVCGLTAGVALGLGFGRRADGAEEGQLYSQVCRRTSSKPIAKRPLRCSIAEKEEVFGLIGRAKGEGGLLVSLAQGRTGFFGCRLRDERCLGGVAGKSFRRGAATGAGL